MVYVNKKPRCDVVVPGKYRVSGVKETTDISTEVTDILSFYIRPTSWSKFLHNKPNRLGCQEILL
jgi:hypothetical protein